MRKIKRLEFVIVPQRGKPLVKSISSESVDAVSWAIFEQLANMLLRQEKSRQLSRVPVRWQPKRRSKSIPIL